MIRHPLSRKKSYIPSDFIVFLICWVLLVALCIKCFSAEQADLATQSNVSKEAPKCECQKLERIKEIGGEVLIDGSVRVVEPIYLKEADFVEISTSVKPASNHVRIYAVANGTFTVIKAQFDDGQERTITNN